MASIPPGSLPPGVTGSSASFANISTKIAHIEDALRKDTVMTSTVPPELVGLITPTHYSGVMALTGAFCAVLIWLVWSRGL